MDEEHFAEDLKNAVKDVEKEGEEAIKKRNPLIWIIGLFLALIIVLMVVPYYGIRLDPQPKEILPIIDAISNVDISVSEINYSERVEMELNDVVDVTDSAVKIVADRIVGVGCGSESSHVCHAKAIFFFVRDNFNYVSDPGKFEYVKSARESLLSEGGDCDDASVLLSNLLEAVGIQTRFVFITGHVYVEANIPEAIERYKNEFGWIVLDATCSYCEFGEIPYKNVDKEKRYLSV